VTGEQSYLLLGVGMPFESVEATTAFHPTLREHGWVRAAQVGLGIMADLPGGFFAGADYRGFATSSFSAFSLDFGVTAGFTSFFLGWRT
jgi:hypothetical protein